MLGFGAGDELGELSVTLNGQPLGKHEEENDLKRLCQTRRAVKFHCPPGIIKTGENVMTLRKTSGGKHKLVWAELRL